jgi:uncharacterized HAD superfamily protein
LKIGIDIDGVTADFVTPFLPVLRRILSRDVRYEDITTYRFQDAFGFGEEVELHTQAEIDRLDLLRHLPQVPGALEIINRLSVAHEVHFVTARPGDRWGSVTKDWLGACGFVYRSVMFREGRKAEVADGFSVFVEDKLETALELADVGIHVFLFDRPWNQAEGLPENCVRVSSWQEIEDQMPEFGSI